MQLLATRRFGTFVGASLLSNIGTWAQQVAQPWLLLSLGASPFVVGLDAFALGAPAWLLTIAGGVIADRLDRRRVIAGFQSLQMLCPIALVALLLTDTVRPWTVVAISAVVGITDALSMPSFQSIVPSIVRRDQIAAGLALNATQFNLSRILGPALAGLLLASVGAVGCFAVNALSYVPFILVAVWILPRAAVRSVGRTRLVVSHLFDGAREAASLPQLRGALLTRADDQHALRSVDHLLPRAREGRVPRRRGPVQHRPGSVRRRRPAGRRRHAVRRRQPRIDAGCGSWLAVAHGGVTVLVALSVWFAGLVGLLVMAGIALSISNTAANTLVQSAAPPTLRGQSVGLYMLAVRGGLSLGGDRVLLTGVSIGLARCPGGAGDQRRPSPS